MKTLLIVLVLFPAAYAQAQIGLAATSPHLVTDTVPTGELPAGPGEIELLGGILVAKLPMNAKPVALRFGGALFADGETSGVWLPAPAGTSEVLAMINAFEQTPENWFPTAKSLFPGGWGDQDKRLGAFSIDRDPRLQTRGLAVFEGGGKQRLYGAWVLLPDQLAVRLLDTVEGDWEDERAITQRLNAFIASMRVGPRRLALQAGRRVLDNGLSIALPRGFIVRSEHPHGEDDYLFERPVPVQGDHQVAMDIEVSVDKPSLVPSLVASGWQEEPGLVLGQPMHWYRQRYDQKHLTQLFGVLDDVAGHGQLWITLQAATDAEVDELRGYAETLERASIGAGAAKVSAAK